MFRFKREEKDSSNNDSQSSIQSDTSDNSVTDIIDLVDKLELKINQVQETVLPSLQSDLKKVKKKLYQRTSRTRKTTTKKPPSLQNDFKHISAQSKFGYTKGERVTILNTLVIDGYTVPDRYKTGTVVDFTVRFVVISITYKRSQTFYTKPTVYRTPKYICLA